MRLTIANLAYHITFLMQDKTEHSEANKEIEIIKEVGPEKTQEKYDLGWEVENIDLEVSNIDMEKVESVVKEVNKKEEKQLNCDICVYKCKTEKTLSKHMNTKHLGYMSCNTCGAKFSSSETLSTHISNAQKRKENVDCGNWICMEETGSCGGYCVYNIPIPLKSSKNKD